MCCLQGVGLVKAQNDQYCFANAVLHGVAAVPELSNLVKAFHWLGSTTLLGGMADLVDSLHSAKIPVNPDSLDPHIQKICRYDHSLSLHVIANLIICKCKVHAM